MPKPRVVFSILWSLIPQKHLALCPSTVHLIYPLSILSVLSFSITLLLIYLQGSLIRSPAITNIYIISGEFLLQNLF